MQIDQFNTMGYNKIWYHHGGYAKKKLVLLGEMSKKHVITKINVQKHCKCPKNMISP